MKTSLPQFKTGPVVYTPGAKAAIDSVPDHLSAYLWRHTTGDWGDLCNVDKKENDYAVERHLRIFSVYVLSDATKIWIITEADRSSTTVLLPSEY